MNAARRAQQQLCPEVPLKFAQLSAQGRLCDRYDLRGRARYWGWSIGKAYGEPFASREPIGVGDFDALL